MLVLLVLPQVQIGAYDDDDVGVEADFNNMDNTIDVSPIPTLRVHKDHPKGQILGDPKLAVQIKSMKRLSMKKRFGKRESYMETEEALDERRQSGETEEVK
ncbi:hypothetical protein Tco_0208114, partial [Tanacetum coccineum]